MKPLNRLPPWQRRLGGVSGLLLLTSGAAWLWLHFAFAVDGLPHPGEAWAMKLHGAAAMLALWADALTKFVALGLPLPEGFGACAWRHA